MKICNFTELKAEGSSPSSIPRLLHLPCTDKTVTNGNVGTKGSSTKVITEDVVHDIEKVYISFFFN